MYACPLCEASVREFQLRCSQCDSDLKILALLTELPDVQFNQALQAAQRGDLVKATLLLNAVLAARMDDFDAWLLSGTLYARRGQLDVARECMQMALMFKPNEPRARATLAQIGRLEQETCKPSAD